MQMLKCVSLFSWHLNFQMSEDKCLLGAERHRSKRGIGAGAIVGICIVLMLIIGIAAWCVYAYRHPTSKSGLFLIDVSCFYSCFIVDICVVLMLVIGIAAWCAYAYRHPTSKSGFFLHHQCVSCTL